MREEQIHVRPAFAERTPPPTRFRRVDGGTVFKGKFLTRETSLHTPQPFFQRKTRR